ncbi:MAG: hypothetical protein NZU63_00645 [Gemmataceae bacterium]|nr:hypothetical protein [Gemmataceae bacterium]MDW8242257.1 hypothetical protein [Thermogemmata sp.]
MDDGIMQPLFEILGTDQGFRSDPEVVELALLLPRWQVVALEAIAHHYGMTTGQMIRKLLAEVLAALPSHVVSPDRT